MVPLRVLIVEDSMDDAMLLVRELRRGDYDVQYECVDTAAAMDLALRKGEWDLVVCDYSMPTFSGSEALHLLRSNGWDIPFIFLSGTIGEDAAVAALKQGAQDYIMKDNLKRLLPAIQRELDEARRRRERKRLEEQVRQLEKFEGIGRLAGGIAHDFNNALGVILGWIDLCCEQAADGTVLLDQLQKIREQAKNAAGLTSQLLAFARQQVLQPKVLSLNALIAETTDLLRSVMGREIQVQVDTAEGIPATRADPTQLARVIMNLSLNARDAMPNGGRLRISTGMLEIGEDVCRTYTWVEPGRFLVMSVSDTGIGMDSATMARVFEPFFTTKELGRGTGLGLATVYGIVKQHGGFLRVESESNVGTTFHVHLPANPGIPDVYEAVALDKDSKGRETVLVAEDHDALRELVDRTLSSCGYSVVLARDGEEALRMFIQKSRQISIAVLDVVMPHVSGLDAYSRMRAIRPDLPVILTSGHVASADLQIPKGVLFLQKPYSMQVLSRAVRSVLDQNSLLFASHTNLVCNPETLCNGADASERARSGSPD